MALGAEVSGFDELADDLARVPARMVPKLRGVVAKSAVNTKRIMQRDAKRSRHFKQLAPTINYDLDVHAFSGDGLIEADIGPSGGGSASLAGIAYFGTSRPGGGTVRDPTHAMLEEAPNFYEWAFRATEGLL